MNSLLSTSDNDMTPNGDEIIMKDGNESSARTYRVKTYIRSSFSRKFAEHLTCTLLTTTVIIVGLITLIVITSAILKYQISSYRDSVALKYALANSSVSMVPDVSSSNYSQHKPILTYKRYPYEQEGLDAKSWLNFTEKVIFNDNSNLWVFDAKHDTLNILHRAENNIDAFETLTGENIFLSTSNNTFAIISSLSQNFNTTKYNSSIIFEEIRVKPKSIAFDYIGENVYIVDESKGTLIVVDAYSKDYNVLLEDLCQPSKILLDPSKGIMFILQMLHSITKADMNGENLNVIIRKSGVSAFTIDCKHERIYWVNDVIGIESSDYDGKNIRSFHTDTATIIDLSIWNNRLYWLWQDHHQMSKHQLIFCRADGDICEDYVMQPMNSLENPTSIKVISEESKQLNESMSNNPCKINKNKCEQLCLVIPQGRHSCACKLGWQLNPDKRTCRETRDFILYSTDRTIRGRTLDVTRRVLNNVILPTPYHLKSLKSHIIFDYDYRLDILYFSDCKTIFKMNLKGYRNQTTLLENSENVITDLSYDWISGNLYTVEYNDHPSYYITDDIEHYIKVFDLKQGAILRQVVLKTFTNGYSGHSSLCIYPERHYIFYVAMVGYTQSINGLSTTDNNSSTPFGTLQESIDNLARPMAIDYAENRLYWLYTNDFSTHVEHANLDGTDHRSFVVENIASPSSIFVYREWIFMSNVDTIWRVQKKDGQNPITLVMKIPTDNNVIGDVRLISDAIQSTS